MGRVEIFAFVAVTTEKEITPLGLVVTKGLALRQMATVNRIGGTSFTILRCGLMVERPAVNRTIVGSIPTT